MGERETFFGAFLAFTKKVPAGRRTAEALDLKKPKLDSSFRWNDELDQKLDSSFRWNDEREKR